jgi:hypothetical protein
MIDWRGGERSPDKIERHQCLAGAEEPDEGDTEEDIPHDHDRCDDEVEEFCAAIADGMRQEPGRQPPFVREIRNLLKVTQDALGGFKYKLH